MASVRLCTRGLEVHSALTASRCTRLRAQQRARSTHARRFQDDLGLPASSAPFTRPARLSTSGARPHDDPRRRNRSHTKQGSQPHQVGFSVSSLAGWAPGKPLVPGKSPVPGKQLVRARAHVSHASTIALSRPHAPAPRSLAAARTHASRSSLFLL